MSRDAAIVMTIKKAQALAACSARIVDCKAAREIAEAAARDVFEYAQRTQWWSVYGPALVLGVGAAALVLGVIAGALFGGFFNVQR